MSIYIKKEPTFETSFPLVSIPLPETDIDNCPLQPEQIPFCTLCIRECPAGVEIFEFNSENSNDFRHSMLDLFGLQVRLQGFSICKTCWKMVQMIGDFREGCRKAQSWMERTDGVGLKSLDDWSSEQTGLTIDTLQKVIVDHTKRIEQSAPAEDELFTVLSVDQIKVQADDPEEVVQKDRKDCDGQMNRQETPNDELLLKATPKKLANKKPEEKKFYCKLCDLGFTRIGHLIRHKERSVHLQRLRILNKLKTVRSSGSDCNTEKVEIITPDDDLLVVQSVEELGSKKAEKNPYKCEECDIIFKSGHHIRMHKLSEKHLQAVKFYREETNVEIGEFINNLQNETNGDEDSESMLISQQPTKRKKSTISNHKCPKCDAIMATKHSLRIHLKYVHSEASFKCNHCSAKYKTKNALKRHLFLQHVASRDYICPVCGNRYWEASALEGHLMQHKGYRPFECDKCDKGYHNQKLLDRHVRKCH